MTRDTAAGVPIGWVLMEEQLQQLSPRLVHDMAQWTHIPTHPLPPPPKKKEILNGQQIVDKMF